MPQLSTFHIGEEMFALNVLMIKEIGRIHEVTVVPESPEYIVGLVNLRGQILTLMDPRYFLECKAADDLKNQQLIILKTSQEQEALLNRGLIQEGISIKNPLAIVIDRIGDVLDVKETDIAPPPPNLSGVNREFVQGVIQLEKKVVIQLDAKRLVQQSLEKAEAMAA